MSGYTCLALRGAGARKAAVVFVLSFALFGCSVSGSTSDQTSEEDSSVQGTSSQSENLDEEERLRKVDDCVRDKGISVKYTEDGTLFNEGGVVPASEVDDAIRVCDARFPAPLTDSTSSETQFDYDYWSQVTICLQDRGYPVAPMPSREVFQEFVDSGFDSSYGIENPLDALATVDDAEYSAALDACQ